MTLVEGGVAAPIGFRASGAAGGVKSSPGTKDCALVFSDAPATVAGRFTTNLLKAAPVLWDAAVCERGRAQAVFVNSGNANACTGEQGAADVRATAQIVGHGLGISAEDVCVCSTGVIGVPLPMNAIAAGARLCVETLSRDGGTAAAEAIMTTDTVAKEAAFELRLADGVVRIGAMAKGAGMIAPNMATMICVITTDAHVDAEVLSELLGEAVSESFNRICVDNDMSTSDTVLCLANGRSGAGILAPGSAGFLEFAGGLKKLCRDMARRIVQDGEGATKCVEITVSGAATDDDAYRIARAVAMSQLCKTAFFGCDPNWGRIACAAGYAGAPFDPAALSIAINDVALVKNGAPADYDETEAAKHMKRPQFQVRVSVGEGPGSAEFWTTDLSEEYVRINADYRT